MAAKERAVLLRSARRKILQNSICRQRQKTEIEFCKNLWRVLPLQGLAAKAGGPLQSRHQWERAGCNRRRRASGVPACILSPVRSAPGCAFACPPVAVAVLPRKATPHARRDRRAPPSASGIDERGWPSSAPRRAPICNRSIRGSAPVRSSAIHTFRPRTVSKQGRFPRHDNAVLSAGQSREGPASFWKGWG